MLDLPKLNTGIQVIDAQWEKLCRKVSAFIEHHPITLAEGALHGNILYTSANKTMSLAIATAAATSRWVGVASMDGDLGDQIEMTTSNVERVRLETGLTPLSGQPIYVSATTAGAGTNVAPINPNYDIRVGVIVDASMYGAQTPYVDAILQRCCTPTLGQPQ